jgi:hypothetical protein
MTCGEISMTKSEAAINFKSSSGCRVVQVQVDFLLRFGLEISSDIILGA